MKSSRKKKAEPLSQRLKTDFQKNWLLYVMLLPVLIYLIIFCYAPMYGVIIAFKNFKPRLGILGSDWVDQSRHGTVKDQSSGADGKNRSSSKK